MTITNDPLQTPFLVRHVTSPQLSEIHHKLRIPEIMKGDTARLKTWRQRGGKALGEDVPGRPAPLIDQIHHLMHLWNAGDVVPVDTYLDRRGLRRNALFPPLLQALIELAEAGSQERAILESLSNHLQIRGLAPDRVQSRFIEMEEDNG